jgi:hypothetical protein
MVRDVATQWNSTAELLERTLQLREAINLLDKLFPLLEVGIVSFIYG